MFGVPLDEGFDQGGFSDLNDILATFYFRMMILTPGGPTTATMIGGASSGMRSTSGTCSRFSLI